MNQCFHCGEEIEPDDEAQEEVVDLPTGDGWAFVHVECPKKLPALTLQYREAKARADLASAEVERVKCAIDRALGARALLAVGGYELRRVEGTLLKKWDNRLLNDLLYALRHTGNEELAEAIAACRTEEPRRGYLRIGPAK
jgi:hypothetical protein